MVNRNIPKNIRHMVWNKYIGINIAISKCFVGCNREINWQNYECGHIIAKSKGGSTELDNLLPICSQCNKSIGNKNMDEFKNEYRLNNKSTIKVSTSKQDIIYNHEIVKFLRSDEGRAMIKDMMGDKDRLKKGILHELVFNYCKSNNILKPSKKDLTEYITQSKDTIKDLGQIGPNYWITLLPKEDKLFK